MAAIRYVSLNPVRAGLVARPEDWPWSSVRAHLSREDDGLVTVGPVLDRTFDVRKLFLPDPGDEAVFSAMRLSEGTGRPLANSSPDSSGSLAV